MNTNKVFLVNDPTWGSRVVTKGVLVNDIKQALAQNGQGKVKAKDIEEFADGFVESATGKALDQKDYAVVLQRAANSLREYSQLTSYKFFEITGV